MISETPLWVDAIAAVLVVLGGIAALVGSLGLHRFNDFFDRVHAPTLGATVGTWSFTIATVLQVSFARGQLFVHALVIAVFIALAAPVTTIFLMRAAVFRARMRGVGIPDLAAPSPEPAEAGGGEVETRS